MVHLKRLGRELSNLFIFKLSIKSVNLWTSEINDVKMRMIRGSKVRSKRGILFLNILILSYDF